MKIKIAWFPIELVNFDKGDNINHWKIQIDQETKKRLYNNSNNEIKFIDYFKITKEDKDKIDENMGEDGKEIYLLFNTIYDWQEILTDPKFEDVFLNQYIDTKEEDNELIKSLSVENWKYKIKTNKWEYLRNIEDIKINIDTFWHYYIYITK